MRAAGRGVTSAVPPVAAEVSNCFVCPWRTAGRPPQPLRTGRRSLHWAAQKMTQPRERPVHCKLPERWPDRADARALRSGLIPLRKWTGITCDCPLPASNWCKNPGAGAAGAAGVHH